VCCEDLLLQFSNSHGHYCYHRHHTGTDVSSIESIPEEQELTPVEIENAQKRWQLFAQEMKKPASYTSKYKLYLQQLDKIGAINLERISRDQIPSLRIDRCISLFFCPYEGLPHTLDLGSWRRRMGEGGGGIGKNKKIGRNIWGLKN
jgi:hypothetical protein